MTHLRGTYATRTELQGDAGYGAFNAPFGEVFIVWQGRTLLWLGLPQPRRDRDALLNQVRNWAPNLTLRQDADGAEKWGKDIINAWKQGKTPELRLCGTEFEQRVWQELLAIPYGQTCSYGDIAARIGSPRAARAVGQAVGSNPVTLLVPCHRVLPANGKVGNYGWGPEIKKRLLEEEGVRLSA